MMTARFSDGSACRLEAVRGDGFEPREGDTYLFEFPEGALKEGTIHFGHSPEVYCWAVPRTGVFDRRSKVVALEVS